MTEISYRRQEANLFDSSWSDDFDTIEEKNDNSSSTISTCRSNDSSTNDCNNNNDVDDVVVVVDDDDDDDNDSFCGSPNESQQQQHRRDSEVSTSTASSTTSTVTFGTVTIREYERQLDSNTDVDLGLSIGWKFRQHGPVDVDMYEDPEEDDGCHRDAFYTSEEERARILLASGYSKGQLRKAFRRKYDGDEDLVEMPYIIRSLPSQMMYSISNRFSSSKKQKILQKFAEEQNEMDGEVWTRPGFPQ